MNGEGRKLYYKNSLHRFKTYKKPLSTADNGTSKKSIVSTATESFTKTCKN